MAAGRMIDGIASASRSRPALEQPQLRDLALVVYQRNTALGKKRQGLAVDRRLVELRRFVPDAGLRECVRDPGAGVAIARHSSESVILQDSGKALDNRARLMRRRNTGEVILHHEGRGALSGRGQVLRVR